jgi:hypothetical protein
LPDPEKEGKSMSDNESSSGESSLEQKLGDCQRRHDRDKQRTNSTDKERESEEDDNFNLAANCDEEEVESQKTFRGENSPSRHRSLSGKRNGCETCTNGDNETSSSAGSSVLIEIRLYDQLRYGNATKPKSARHKDNGQPHYRRAFERVELLAIIDGLNFFEGHFPNKPKVENLYAKIRAHNCEYLFDRNSGAVKDCVSSMRKAKAIVYVETEGKCKLLAVCIYHFWKKLFLRHF